MPYLEPETVVKRFSSYLHHDVRDAIDEDHQFVKAQVGSMSSSMNFLARELGGARVAVNTQRRRLRDALDGVAEATEADEVLAAVATARDRVDEAEGDPRDVEVELTAAATAVFEAIDESLDGEAARAARRPLYEFLETRVETQLDLLR
jgi:hypothetical protein